MAVASTSGMKKCKEAKTARICGARNGEQEARKKKKKKKDPQVPAQRTPLSSWLNPKFYMCRARFYWLRRQQLLGV